MFSPLFCLALEGYFRGADVLWFGDNQTVNFSALKGYSAVTDVARLVSSWTLRGVELACRSWLHWVPSKSNVAVPLSRPSVLGLSDDSSLLGWHFLCCGWISYFLRLFLGGRFRLCLRCFFFEGFVIFV